MKVLLASGALLVAGCTPTLAQPGSGFVEWDAISDATSVAERRCHGAVRLIDKRRGYLPRDYRCETPAPSQRLVVRLTQAGAECLASIGDVELRRREWEPFLAHWRNKSSVEIVVQADHGADCASAFSNAAQTAHFRRVDLVFQPAPKLM